MASLCLALSDKPLLANQWSYVLSHFHLEQVYIIGNNKWNDLHHLKDAISIRTCEDLPKKPIVVLAPKDGSQVRGEQSLIDFQHSKDCIYVFGADHEALSLELVGERDYNSVYIPTDTKFEMYAHVAAAITLYDRKQKHG